MTGRIFDIQKFSIHDGPGIRTTVFLKGCPLRCHWCHNPEAMSGQPQLSYAEARCVGCGECYRVCPHGAHLPSEGHYSLDRSACRVCGLCAGVCGPQALEMVGRVATVDEVMEQVLADRPFYESSGGGMTLSGGEPLAQVQFTEALLREAKNQGLHCCVETCGHAPWAALRTLLPLVDLFLYDIKETDSARHLEWTGVGNELILENLGRLHEAGARICIRLPLVPTRNDREDHFAAVAELSRRLPRLHGLEVMAYHRLGAGKRQRLGLAEGPLESLPAPAAATVAGWKQRLRELGATVT